MKIILASGSPRRKELLEREGLDFLVIPADCEEVAEPGPARDVVVSLAKQKALWVAEKEKKRINGDTIVIGADTVVSLDDVILGKPKDREDAFSMLSSLSGREHEVYTGVALVSGDGKVMEAFSVCTKVRFRRMTDDEINGYIDTGEPMDKAGAYGIQGKGGAFVESVTGDFDNVVGLPVGEVVKRLPCRFF